MPFKSYVAELKTIRNSGKATENSYYTALGSLVEDLDPSVAVVINPKKTPHGSPDFHLTRTRTANLTSFADDIVCYKLVPRKR